MTGLSCLRFSSGASITKDITGPLPIVGQGHCPWPPPRLNFAKKFFMLSTFWPALETHLVLSISSTQAGLLYQRARDMTPASPFDKLRVRGVLEKTLGSAARTSCSEVRFCKMWAQFFLRRGRGAMVWRRSRCMGLGAGIGGPLGKRQLARPPVEVPRLSRTPFQRQAPVGTRSRAAPGRGRGRAG